MKYVIESIDHPLSEVLGRLGIAESAPEGKVLSVVLTKAQVVVRISTTPTP